MKNFELRTIFPVRLFHVAVTVRPAIRGLDHRYLSDKRHRVMQGLCKVLLTISDFSTFNSFVHMPFAVSPRSSTSTKIAALSMSLPSMFPRKYLALLTVTRANDFHRHYSRRSGAGSCAPCKCTASADFCIRDGTPSWRTSTTNAPKSSPFSINACG